MSKQLEFILKFPNFAPVQLSPEHQKEFNLPKHCTVGELKEAMDAKKEVKKQPAKMIVKDDESTNL